MPDDNEIHLYDLPPLTHIDSRAPLRSPFEWAMMILGCELALINLGLGATLIVANPLRTAAPSFDPIKELMPMPWWGYAFLITGLLAVVGQLFYRLGVVAVSHALAGSFSLFWTAGFTTGLTNPVASATGIWAYCGLGLTHWIVAATTVVKAQRVHQKTHPGPAA